MSADSMRVLFRDCADELAGSAVPPPVATVRARAGAARDASSGPVRADRARVRRRPVAIAGLAAAALAGMLVFQTLPGPDGGAARAPAAAAVVVLERAAGAAAAAAAASPGRYMLTEAVRTGAVTVLPAAGGDAVTYLQDDVAKTWTAVDGRGEGLTEITYGKITWLSPKDRGRVAASDLAAFEGQVVRYPIPSPAQPSELPPGHTREVTEDNGQRVEVIRNAAGQVVSTTALAEQPEVPEPYTPTYQRLLDLPTDPSALYVQITRDAAEPQETLDLVGVLLAHNIAPPDVRAALFLAAKRIPGVDVLPDADGQQRRVTLGVTGPYIRSELLIDTGTGTLVGRRQVTVVDHAFKGAPAGTTVLDEVLTAKFVQTIAES